jgi:PAS domain S-box-containing protein
MVAPLDLRQALDMLPDAVIACDARGDVAYANDEAGRVLGRAAGEIAGRALVDLAPARLRHRYARLLASRRAAAAGSAGSLTLTVVAEGADGAELPLALTLRSLDGGGFVGTLRPSPARAERERQRRERDLVGRERAARLRLTTQVEVAGALANASAADDALAVVLGAVGERLGWCATRFWWVDPVEGVLRNVAAWSGAGDAPPSARTYSLEEGGPGRVWSTGEAQWAPTSDDAPQPVAEPVAEGAGEAPVRHGTFWFPVHRRGEVHGVIELVGDAEHPAHDGLIETMRGLADQLAQFLERAGIEEQLRASEERLTTTLKSIADAVIATDVRGRVTFMNSVAEQLTGWPFEEARARPLGQVFAIRSEDDQAPIESPVERVLRDGLVVGLANHTALVARSGEVHSIEDSGAPIVGEDGILYGVVLVFRDVTQLRRADRRRRFLAQAASTLASSIDYEQTLSNVAHLAVPRLADWCVVYVVDEGEGRLVPLAMANVDPDRRDQARAAAAALVASPDPKDGKDGIAAVLRTLEPLLLSDVTPESAAAASLADEPRRLLGAMGARSAMFVPLVAHGRAIGAVSFVAAESRHRYDEADLGVAEELAVRAALAIDNARLHRSLREGEERMRLVLESVGEAIVGVDLRGSCVFANPAGARLLGYASHDQLVGKDIRELFHPPTAESSMGSRPPPSTRAPRIDELCLDSEPSHVAEERLGRVDGTSFWAECWSYPVQRAGQRVGGVVTFIDITERKRAEEEHKRLLRELEEAVHLRDDFLSIASHELRTPLTPLQLHVQGIQRALRRGADGITPAEILTRLDSVARQIARIERLVDSLLDIARITSKRMLLQPEPVDLGALVREVITRSRDELSRSGTEVTVHADEPVVGQWDRLRIEQVVTNLLSNAMKFGSGQPIEVFVGHNALTGDARLVVRDHGIGIAGEDQRRIFDRFERAVPSRHYGGFGLGLWIVHQIVSAMGGTVGVESTPGEGATFFVEVPLAEMEQHALAS